MDRIEYLKLLRKQINYNYNTGYITFSEYMKSLHDNNDMLAEERIKRLNNK